MLNGQINGFDDRFIIWKHSFVFGELTHVAVEIFNHIVGADQFAAFHGIMVIDGKFLPVVFPGTTGVGIFVLPLVLKTDKSLLSLLQVDGLVDGAKVFGEVAFIFIRDVTKAVSYLMNNA